MKKLAALFSATILLMLFITGCEKNSTASLDPAMQDQTEIQNFASDDQNDYLFDWGVDDGAEGNMYDGYNNFSAAAPAPLPLSVEGITSPLTNVVRFGRKINRRFKRTIVIRRVNEDTAKVFVERVLEGKFVIFEKLNADSTDPDTLAVFRKPLRHIVRRSAIFVRRQNVDTAATDDARGHWRIYSVSLGEGESPNSTIDIADVTVSRENGESVVYTDPLQTQLVLREDLLRFVPGEIIKVKVRLSNSTSNPVVLPQSAATETLLLHFGANPRHHGRKRFHFVGVDDEGLNVYEGKWVVRQRPHHVYHAIVDAIDNGTIYDNDADAFPYNSTTWGIPYIVKARN